jgi:hypothetical protein
MTGSGACVFVAQATEAHARRIAAACPPEFAAHAVRGVTQSPLLGALRDRTGRSGRRRSGATGG